MGCRCGVRHLDGELDPQPRPDEPSVAVTAKARKLELGSLDPRVATDAGSVVGDVFSNVAEHDAGRRRSKATSSLRTWSCRYSTRVVRPMA